MLKKMLLLLKNDIIGLFNLFFSFIIVLIFCLLLIWGLFSLLNTITTVVFYIIGDQFITDAPLYILILSHITTFIISIWFLFSYIKLLYHKAKNNV